MSSNNAVCATSKASYQPAHMRSLIRSFASRLRVELLTEHHLVFLTLLIIISLKGSCTDSSESTLVMLLCW